MDIHYTTCNFLIEVVSKTQYFLYFHLVRRFFVDIVICIFNGNFSAECAIRPPSKRVGKEPVQNLFVIVWFPKQLSEIRNVWPVPLSASTKYNRPLWLLIACIILSHAMRCTGGLFLKFTRKNSSTNFCQITSFWWKI